MATIEVRCGTDTVEVDDEHTALVAARTLLEDQARGRVNQGKKPTATFSVNGAVVATADEPSIWRALGSDAPRRTYRIYRCVATDGGYEKQELGRVEDESARGALMLYAGKNGLVGDPTGRNAFAAAGFGILHAEEIGENTVCSPGPESPATTRKESKMPRTKNAEVPKVEAPPKPKRRRMKKVTGEKACLAVLVAADRPMTVSEITREVMAAKMVNLNGKTPEATLAAKITRGAKLGRTFQKVNGDRPAQFVPLPDADVEPDLVEALRERLAPAPAKRRTKTAS